MRAQVVAVVSGALAICSLVCPWKTIEVLVRAIMFFAGAYGLYLVCKDEVKDFARKFLRTLSSYRRS